MDLLKISRANYMLTEKKYSKYKDLKRLKLKGQKKYAMLKTSKQKKIAIIISENLVLMTGTVIGDKEESYIMIKYSILYKDTIFLNSNTLNNRASKYEAKTNISKRIR